MLKKLLIITILSLSATAANAQMFAVKCDLLKGVAMTPNLGIDFVFGERTTFGVDVFGAKKIWGKDVKMLAVTPEYRYWFGGRPFIRHFVEVSALVGNYDIKWKKKMYDGNAAGIGFAFGRTYKISSRFNFEILGGLMMLRYKQKEYYEGDIYEDYGEKMNSKGSTILPKIEASISYIIR